MDFCSKGVGSSLDCPTKPSLFSVTDEHCLPSHLTSCLTCAPISLPLCTHAAALSGRAAWPADRAGGMHSYAFAGVEGEGKIVDVSSRFTGHPRPTGGTPSGQRGRVGVWGGVLLPFFYAGGGGEEGGARGRDNCAHPKKLLASSLVFCLRSQLRFHTCTAKDRVERFIAITLNVNVAYKVAVDKYGRFRVCLLPPWGVG